MFKKFILSTKDGYVVSDSFLDEMEISSSNATSNQIIYRLDTVVDNTILGETLLYNGLVVSGSQKVKIDFRNKKVENL